MLAQKDPETTTGQVVTWTSSLELKNRLARLRAESRAKSRQVMSDVGSSGNSELVFLWHARLVRLGLFNPAGRALRYRRSDGDWLRSAPHNTYVKIAGLTDYRGVQQSRLRGLTGWTKEHKYLKLTGANVSWKSGLTMKTSVVPNGLR